MGWKGSVAVGKGSKGVVVVGDEGVRTSLNDRGDGSGGTVAPPIKRLGEHTDYSRSTTRATQIRKEKCMHPRNM
jgi:hypothetical protein